MKKIWNPGTVLNISKYLALKRIIESNGWCVELFAVEVGATRYCSKPVYAVLKNWVSAILLSRALLKN